MCGIGAIIGWQGSREGLERAIHGMWRALTHRGPDDAGIWISPDATTALCHHRLAILDLTSAGHQPMASLSGHLRIVFNGEIYNYVELRSELSAAGAHFQGNSDTEVILAGVEREGIAFIKKLEGMFALVVHDERSNQAWLARDSFGIKPLYQTIQKGALFAASEVRALLASGEVPRKLANAGLMGFLQSGSVPEPYTLIEGVHMFPAAHAIQWRTGQDFQPTPYWELNFAPQPDSDWLEKTQWALQTTVARHLVSDVPVGIFLSGGLDSFAIARLAAKSLRGMTSYSISTPGADFDETQAVAQSAHALGLTAHSNALGPVEASHLFNDYLNAQDQPSIDGFNIFCVARFARSLGAKVVLSGLGGDEWFGGYGTFQRAPRLTQIANLIRSGNWPASTAGHYLEHFSSHAKLRRLGAWMQRKPSLKSSLQLVRGIFSDDESRQLARHYGLRGQTAMSLNSVHHDCPGDAVSRLEIQGYMLNQLLRDGDSMTMAHGLEMRLPLLDRQLATALAGIPANIRLRPGKELLAEAVSPLPDHLVNVRKKGFLLPFDQWLAHPEWQQIFQPLQAPAKISLNPWYRKWGLFALDRWIQKHL